MKWVVGLVLCSCISPVMQFGEGKSAKQAQHDTLNEFIPATLDTSHAYSGPVRNAKVVVYADDEYRAQNLKWEQTFGDQLDRANAVLEPQFGLHLVADYHAWDHHTPGHALEEDLGDLRTLDDGRGAFAVIGLTSSLGLVSATFELLGVATLGGNHVMLRGFADLEERKDFERVFPDLSADERARAYEIRRRHKTAAILLHELGHNLGMNHEDAEDTLMSARYSDHSTGFSVPAHATIQKSIDQRVGGGHREAPAAGKPAEDPASVHPKLVIHLTATQVVIDGRPRDPSDLGIAFSGQVALDPETEVILQKDKGVPPARVGEVIDRAKAAGLTHFTFE
jgi:biopolymer transport protein ExbD/TolR/matrixin